MGGRDLIFKTDFVFQRSAPARPPASLHESLPPPRSSGDSVRAVGECQHSPVKSSRGLEHSSESAFVSALKGTCYNYYITAPFYSRTPHFLLTPLPARCGLDAPKREREPGAVSLYAPRI